MAIRIDQSTPTTTTSLPVDDAQQQLDRSSRVQLNTDNLFERTGGDSDFDPSQFQNQFANDQQRQGAQDRFGSLTAEDQNRVSDAVGSLSNAISGVAAGTASLADAHAALTNAVSTYSSALSNVSASGGSHAFRMSTGAQTAGGDDAAGNAQINDILSYTVGYMENKTGAIAVDLSTKINAKNDIRTESTELSDMISNWPDDGSTQNFTWNSYTVDGEGHVTETQKSQNLTKDQATQLNEDLQSQLDNMDDITQEQQLDLQQKYQDQQQAMTTLSQILSSMNDTMKNTINNTRSSS